MLPFIVFLLFLLPSLLLWKKLAKQRGDGKKLPPGPWRLPIIGNLHQVGSLPHRSLLALSQKHGPLMFLRLGSIPTLVISSGDMLSAIFKSHDVAFSGRPVLQAGKKFSFNNSNISFAPYGAYWRQARKLCVLELLGSRRVRSLRAVREEEVAMLTAAIAKQSSSTPSHPVNLSEMVFSLSYNVMCRAVFGDRHGGGEAVYEGRRSWFHGVMAETQELVAGFCAADFFPGWGWIDSIIGRKARLEKNFEAVKEFYERVIEEHVERAGEDEGGGARREEDLVDVLLRSHREAPEGEFLSAMDHVKGIMGDMFFAGTDTTSATIEWTMAELIRSPRAMAKLQEQLEDVVGAKSKVEEAELEKLHYLKLVIKETLRLHPPAPLLVPRETLSSCEVGGYHIPAETRVFINAAAMARDPRAWENPDEFLPERFAFAGVDSAGKDFSYVPFGVGRRSCPGAEFAAVVAELVLANLLHCFGWRLPGGMRPEDMDMGEAPGLTVHKKEPLRLVAKPRM